MRKIFHYCEKRSNGAIYYILRKYKEYRLPYQQSQIAITQEDGVAIITTIFIMIFASIIAVTLVKGQFIDIQRTSNIFEYNQAYHYAVSGEMQAKQLLAYNIQTSFEIDNTYEKWHGYHRGMKVDNGKVEFYIEDLQNRLNINNLAGSGESLQLNLALFDKLVSKLQLNKNLPDIIQDWLDEDRENRPNGAEDREYIINNNRPFYHTANGLMTDISEVILLLGIDSASYNRLKPYVTTLPETDVKINVNTASDDIIRIITGESENILNVKATKGFITMNELKALTADSAILDVRSNYYIVYTKADYGDSTVFLSSLIYCNKKGDNSLEIKTVYRNLSRKFEISNRYIKIMDE